MSISWRIRVWEPDGTLRDTISVDGAIARLNRFDTDPVGVSLEAEFEAVPADTGIQARDIIRLDVTDDGSTWTPVYLGVIVIAGPARATDLRRYKAVGLKQRYYETLVTDDVIAGDDVTEMARSVWLNTSVTGVAGARDLHALTFELGNRYPALETAGDALDALAQSVGRFIVPTGSSYTYNGVTYDPGDVVPAVRWGIVPGSASRTSPYGLLVFQRPTASPLAVTEGDADTIVVWRDIVAEDVVDSVTLVYATNPPAPIMVRPPSGEAYMTAAYRPVARTFDASASDLDASRLVDISDHALDYMSDVTYHDGHHTALTNPSNGYDGDPTTYAEAGTPTAAGDFVYLRVTNYASGGPRAWDGMARVRFVAGTESGERRIVISVDDSSIRWYGIVFSEEMEEDDVYDVVFPLPHPLGPDVPAGNLLSPVLTVNVLDGDRIYLCQMYTPEVDTGGELSEALAQAYLREPEADAAEVHLMGQLGPVTPTLTVTPLDGVAVDVPVERIEYSLTNEEGLVTRYYLGQAFNAELMSQAVVLERLAKRAVKG